ncbi:restriction endonuclease subunit S [Staphylococcus canis]|nr:restriction endonuclease subunit S [Staphylococcus canis]
MTAYVTYTNGSLLNRLERDTTDRSISVPIYDHVMMLADQGVYQETEHAPKYLQLSPDHQGKIVEAGDIVMNMMTSECARVSAQHAGSLLPYNYTLITIDTTQLDADYVVYWFNASHAARAQLNQFRQGGTLVKKLTLSHLKQVSLVPPSLKTQQLIGKIAVCRNRQRYLYAKKNHIYQRFLATQLFREDLQHVNN